MGNKPYLASGSSLYPGFPVYFKDYMRPSYLVFIRIKARHFAMINYLPNLNLQRTFANNRTCSNRKPIDN
jgi:hypothetical protein